MSNGTEHKGYKLGNLIYIWLSVIAAIGGMLVGAVFVGKAWGSNENILALPAKINSVQAALDLKITATQAASDLKIAATQATLEDKLAKAQERDSDALKTQVKINEDLLRQYNSLSAELGINSTTDKFQQEDINRLKGLVDDMRKIMK